MRRLCTTNAVRSKHKINRIPRLVALTRVTKSFRFVSARITMIGCTTAPRAIGNGGQRPCNHEVVGNGCPWLGVTIAKGSLQGVPAEAGFKKMLTKLAACVNFRSVITADHVYHHAISSRHSLRDHKAAVGHTKADNLVPGINEESLRNLPRLENSVLRGRQLKGKRTQLSILTSYWCSMVNLKPECTAPLWMYPRTSRWDTDAQRVT